MAHPHGLTIGSVRPVNWAFDRAPMIVYWELTNACGLACKHCRATAMPDPAPGELDTDQALGVLDDIAAFGAPLPHIVMTGGDPLRRRDLGLLVAAAQERGIGVSLAPAVTPLLTRERVAQIAAEGVQAISLSLDGSTAEHHDGVRGVPGTFEHTLEALDWAAAAHLPVQVNTLVTATTAADLPAIHHLLQSKKLMRWSLFFLISVGRGAELSELSPGEAEKLMRWLLQIGRTSGFQVRTTEAMQYRRIAAQGMLRAGRSRAEIEGHPMSRAFGIRDGNGIVFISHTGDITPSGFLPLALGNVLRDPLVNVYRHHAMFRALRQPSGFKGRCGVCDFNDWCGGSRARAFAWTGDPLETDPLCPYVPPGAKEAHGG